MYILTKNSFRWLCVASILPCLSACGLWQDTPQNDQKRMEVSTEFNRLHLCSRISPEIHISNPPKGTYSYEIRLSENLADGERFYGGGAWGFHGVDEDGIEKIPEGVLTKHYRGPCPPIGKISTFTMSVTAVSKEGVPLSLAKQQLAVEKEN